MIIVNGWKLLTIITKSSILDVAAVLDPPLSKIFLLQDFLNLRCLSAFSMLRDVMPHFSNQLLSPKKVFSWSYYLHEACAIR